MTQDKTPQPGAPLPTYCRMPAIHGDRVVFVSEDDLWETSRSGGRVIRLTSGQGGISWPAFSPDGSQLTFISDEEGCSEVYVMPSMGGPMRRLTFDESTAHVVGFDATGDSVIFSSTRRSAHREMQLFEVDATGGQPRTLGVGEGEGFAQQPGGAGRVLGRYRHDLARWKRYRGGLAGELWIDTTGDEAWTRLFPEETAGAIRPMWIGERIYFLSDREGHGNLYSCLSDGTDVVRHTEHVGFFVRATQTDGARIVYTVGGDLHIFDTETGESTRVDVSGQSPRTQLRRKFVDAADYVESYALHPKGHHVCLTTRGKPYNFGLWEGAVRQTGESQGVRYRLADYLPKGDELVMISDAGVTTGSEHLELHDPLGKLPARRVELPEGVELGRIVEFKVCPVGKRVALANHMHELWIVECDAPGAHCVDVSEHGRLDEFDWSSDGRWLAYGKSLSAQTSVIMLHDRVEQVSRQLTSGEFRDSDPAFDPAGRYLYFVSYRTFNPVYGNLFFELSLTRGQNLCLMTLKADASIPFIETPRAIDDKEDEDDDLDEKVEGDDAHKEGGEDDTGLEGESEESRESKESDDQGKDGSEQVDDAPEPVEIDLDGLGERVVAFPLAERVIHQIEATEERVYFTHSVPRGSLGTSRKESVTATLSYWSFEERKRKRMHPQVSGFTLSQDRKTLALWSEEQLRVLSSSASEPDEDEDEDVASRKTGWINLERISVEVDPVQEWRQMFAETWRLMRDDFWREDMSGVDWPEAYARYVPLVERVGSRAEFSDLVWTMQGELGTSHAYEFGGDYRPAPSYQAGHLGIDVIWDAQVSRSGEEGSEKGAYRIERMLHGDDWSLAEGSPLRRPGAGVKEGDLVLALDGQRIDATHGLDERLVNKAGVEVELLIYTPGGDAPRTVTARTLGSDGELRYREWVRSRREWVHEHGQGRVGYVHIPDMGPRGYAEFHRSYAVERTHEALIVDVRFNGGGHVSSLILEKLRREPLGYDLSRYGALLPYPQEGPTGPLVALTNEYAGSDGDIFSHGFKMMGLGPLIGRRTWGGVIGIWPRHALVDGSVTTQPSFSFWFNDVGFDVENYGTDPDEEVIQDPRAQAEGDDVQLEHGLRRALALLDASTDGPPDDFAPYPHLAPPKVLP